jgi:hypothetical protein
VREVPVEPAARLEDGTGDYVEAYLLDEDHEQVWGPAVWIEGGPSEAVEPVGLLITDPAALVAWSDRLRALASDLRIRLAEHHAPGSSGVVLAEDLPHGGEVQIGDSVVQGAQQ